jgi:hypothetical protein
MSSPVDHDPKPINGAQRLAQLKRAYQRALGRHPTTVQRTAIQRAALLTVRAEASAFDPTASSNDIVRLDNAARRARNDMLRTFEKPTKRPSMRDIEAEIAAANA